MRILIVYPQKQQRKSKIWIRPNEGIGWKKSYIALVTLSSSRVLLTQSPLQIKSPRNYLKWNVVCSMKMPNHLYSSLQYSNNDCEPFGYERKNELKRIKGSIFHHKLRELNLTYAQKKTSGISIIFVTITVLQTKIEMIYLYVHDSLLYVSLMKGCPLIIPIKPTSNNTITLQVPCRSDLSRNMKCAILKSIMTHHIIITLYLFLSTLHKHT